MQLGKDSLERDRRCHGVVLLPHCETCIFFILLTVAVRDVVMRDARLAYVVGRWSLVARWRSEEGGALIL